jgi:hypothetical protein
MGTPTVPTWRGHDESWTVDHDSEARERQRLRLLSAGAIAILASGVITVGRPGRGRGAGRRGQLHQDAAGRELPSGCGTISSNPRDFLTANAPAGAVPKAPAKSLGDAE